MIRGTTAKFKFKLPHPIDEFMWIAIKFWQPHNQIRTLPIIKTKANCVRVDDTNDVLVSLTSEETSRFSDRFKAKYQLRALHASTGSVIGTDEQFVTVYPMPDDIITHDPALPVANSDGFIVVDGGLVDDVGNSTMLDGAIIYE